MDVNDQVIYVNMRGGLNVGTITAIDDDVDDSYFLDRQGQYVGSFPRTALTAIDGYKAVLPAGRYAYINLYGAELHDVDCSGVECDGDFTVQGKDADDRNFIKADVVFPSRIGGSCDCPAWLTTNRGLPETVGKSMAIAFATGVPPRIRTKVASFLRVYHCHAEGVLSLLASGCDMLLLGASMIENPRLSLFRNKLALYRRGDGGAAYLQDELLKNA